MNAIFNRENEFSRLHRSAEEQLISQRKRRNISCFHETEQELNIHKIKLKVQKEALQAAQLKLSKAIEEYAELFDYSPIGYFILNKDGIIYNVNKTGINQLGCNLEQLKGKHLSAFLNSKSYSDDFYRHQQQLMDTEKSQQFECEIKRVDGSVFFALIDSTIVKNEKNDFKHFLTTISDISDQKEQEHQIESALAKGKKLNELKSKLISNLSHEFRTPLSTILTSSELLNLYHLPGDTEKRKKHLQKIITSVNRLKEILIDFMSADEIETKKNNPETFDLVQFTKNLVEDIKPFNGTHTINYLYSNPVQIVFLDRILLKTCMNNLLINALKYTPYGGKLEINTKQSTSGNVRIIIKDEGIGIPENDQSHLFETFFRAQNADHIQGTGLGLTITKKLVTLMGGSISFTSKENEGTTFHLKFPKKRYEE